jgi:hypothetical protein
MSPHHDSGDRGRPPREKSDMHLRDSMDEIEFCPECSGRVLEAIQASGFHADEDRQPAAPAPCGPDCGCGGDCGCGCGGDGRCACRR